jgi:hypothetical protein
MKIGIFVVLSLIVQRCLGWPGVPGWAGDVFIPMACLVTPAMLFHTTRWPLLGFGIGLGWDLVMGLVIGPSGIAWSAAALFIGGLTGVVADRSPRMWAAFGALGAMSVVIFQFIALLPLGLAPPISFVSVLKVGLLTGLWCGLVGWIISLNLATRWLRYRVRTLR